MPNTAKSSESIDLHVQTQALSQALTGFSYQTFICTEGYEFPFQSYNGKYNNGSIHMSHMKLQPFDVTNGQFSFKGNMAIVITIIEYTHTLLDVFHILLYVS